MTHDTMIESTASYPNITITSPFVLTLLTTPGSTALRIENSELPADIQVDEAEHREVARRLGAGVQVYDCKSGIYKFREPQANLYDLETVALRGIQFVGPRVKTAQWADADGSRVVAEVMGPRVPAPSPADPTKDVDWLKLVAQEKSGTGVFSEVTFIQRVLTYAGQPSRSCEGDATVSRPYTALYIFWALR